MYEEYNEYDELEKIYYRRKFKRYFVYFFLIIVLFFILYIIINNLKTEDKNSAMESKFIIPKTEIKNEKLTLDPMIPEVKISSKETKKEYKPVKKEIKKEIKKEMSKIKKPKIVIKVSKEGYSLEELIKDYESFPNYETAIRIATIYFNQKDYKKAIEWAKKANNIDAKNEESWLIYAKSLVALGKPKIAKKLLNAYLNIYGENKKIKQYLRSIK